MYDDNEPMKDPRPADERVDMMRSYVEADNQLANLREQHASMSEEIDRMYERTRHLRDVIGGALEFVQSEGMNVAAMNAEAHGYNGWRAGYGHCTCGRRFDSIQDLDAHVRTDALDPARDGTPKAES